MSSNNKISWNRLTQKQWKQELQALLLVSDKALDKALITIHEAQPAIEKVSEEAILDDGIGFNKFDAPILNGFAKQLLSTGSLSDAQRAVVRKKMPKYWRQLMLISKRKHRWA